MSPSKTKAETREALMQAARELFLRQGYTAAGIEQICAAAGATKGALILARAYQRPEIVGEQLTHYRNYLVALFEAHAQRPGRRRQAHTVRNATQPGRT